MLRILLLYRSSSDERADKVEKSRKTSPIAIAIIFSREIALPMTLHVSPTVCNGGITQSVVTRPCPTLFWIEGLSDPSDVFPSVRVSWRDKTSRLEPSR